MALVRRNTAAQFEQQPDTTAQPQAEQPSTAPAPGPVPEQQPKNGDTPAPPGHAAPPTGTPGNTFPKHPSQASGSAESNGPASADRTAMVRRDANAGAVVQRQAKQPGALEELKNNFEVDYDTFDRLKSGSGNIVDSNNNSLGNEIELTVVSWQEGNDVSPGAQSAEAKKVVRYSRDGMSIDGTGQSVNEYLSDLRTGKVDGVPYPNAAIKPKMVLVGILEAAQKDTNLLGKTVQVSLSTQSLKTFNRHRFDVTLAVQLGRRKSYEGAERINIKAESKTSNGNNYTLLICTEATGATA